MRTGKATSRQDPGVQNKGHGACECHPQRIEEWPHCTKSACVFVSWVVRVPGDSVGRTDHNTRYHRITLVTQSTSSMEETQRKHRADLESFKPLFLAPKTTLTLTLCLILSCWPGARHSALEVGAGEKALGWDCGMLTFKPLTAADTPVSAEQAQGRRHLQRRNLGIF